MIYSALEVIGAAAAAGVFKVTHEASTLTWAEFTRLVAIAAEHVSACSGIMCRGSARYDACPHVTPCEADVAEEKTEKTEKAEA